MAEALPLEGVRVLNLGWVWAGPVVGQTLAFLGAEVYKVESTTRIDLLRTLPPFAEGEASPDRCLLNHACWAGNGSVSLNLKKPEARELVLELAAISDVVVENFGPGVLDRMELGYEALKRAREDVVLLSMPAAGLDGPLKDVRTYGLSVTSTTGLDSLVGYKGGDPVAMENAFSDPYAGILGAFAVITALQHRRNSSQGQHIDFSQQEAIMQMVAPAHMDLVLNGRVGGPKANEHPLAVGAPHGVFPCVGDDRWISIAVMNDDEWRGLVDAMETPDWSEELDTTEARLDDIDALHARIAQWTRGFDDIALAERLQAHGVAAAPVLDVRDLLESPHYRARGTFIEVTHPQGYPVTIYGAYVKTSRTEARIEPGPIIGRDDEHVFKDLLGMSEERYRQLVDDEVIY